MKLTHVQVQNFRCILDTGKFSISDLCCLVGKNEAGKTATLVAIQSVRPFGNPQTRFDLTEDYPRRFVTRYQERHENLDAPIVKTWWQMNDDGYDKLCAEFGKDAIGSREFMICKNYNQDPFWEFDIDDYAVLASAIKSHRLNASEQASFKQCLSIAEAIDAFKGIERPTAKQQEFAGFLQNFPNSSTSCKAGELIDDLVPKFFYTSHYDRMSGQLSAKAIAEQQNIGNFKPEDKIFLDFLRLAGTSLDELNQSPRYEELNAKCEAASADITEQIFEYWSQNDHLKVEVRLSEGRKEDPPPFHSGAVARARIFNNLHQVSVAFSERSAGFVWFFSFLVQFTMMRRDASNVILLLDEPGLTLHGKAQADLLHYIEAELLPKYQIIYTAHSPFMVPTSRLVDCRIVEDIQMRGTNSRVYSEGTRISEDVLSTDKDTLFPLQGALGYSVTQSLFVGENTLLVEGPSDILYLSALSNEIEKRGGTSLNPKWTLCPAGGIDNIKPFLSLFVGNELNIAVLTDKVQGDKSKIERIRQSEILSRERFHTFAELLDKGEGEIEDVFEPELFCIIINNAYELNAEHKITPEKLNQYSESIRQAKRIEKHFNTLPDHIPEFNHYRPAEWLIRNGTILSKKSDAVDRTLETAETIFAIYNKLL